MTDPDPLADLAAEVKQSTRRHEDWLHEHGQMLSEMVPGHELLTWLVAEMREHVNVLLAEIPAEVKYPPICWATSSSKDAEKIWGDLAVWVRDILVARFHPSRRELPDCWPLHVGAVENLLWLKRSWHLMFARAANQNLAAEWYTRWRADAIKELGEAIGREAVTSRTEKCSVGMHLGHVVPGIEPPPAQPPPHLQPPVLAHTAPGGFPGQQLPPGVQQFGQAAQQQFPPGVDPAAGGWSQQVIPEAGRVKVDDPSDDLAAAKYWWPQLEHARRMDLAARREQERAAADAKAAEKAAADERLAGRFRDEVGGAPSP